MADEYISQEWARQLCFMAYGRRDPSIRIAQVARGMRTIVFPVPGEPFGRYELKLEKYYDAVNQEITPIGYSYIGDCFVYGPTAKR